MKLIALPRLRLNQLQTLAENSVRICQALPQLEAALANVVPVLAEYKDSMNKPQTSAAQREEFDKSRDQALLGFTLDVRSNLYYAAHPPEVLQALQNLAQLLDKYDDIRYLPLDEETAAIDNLQAELRSVDFAPLAGATLVERWLPLIEEENNAFKRASQNWLSEKAQAEQVAAPGKIAPALRQQLQGLYAMLAASYTMQPQDAALKNAYYEITQLVGGFS